jgi:broad specificity phosphatase PhoE
MRVLLVRHGRSAHVHDGHWTTPSGVAEFERAYDAAGIREDDPPPHALVSVAREAAMVASSNLARAVESARRIADGRPVVVSELLREVTLEPPLWLPLPLPIQIWEAMNHAQWSYRLLLRVDHEHTRRARAAAQWLMQLVPAGATGVVVTHGSFRRVLARQLLAAGWRSASARRSYQHWSVWSFLR